MLFTCTKLRWRCQVESFLYSNKAVSFCCALWRQSTTGQLPHRRSLLLQWGLECSHLIPPSRLSVVQLCCDNCSGVSCGAWLGAVWQHLAELNGCLTQQIWAFSTKLKVKMSNWRSKSWNPLLSIIGTVNLTIKQLVNKHFVWQIMSEIYVRALWELP